MLLYSCMLTKLSKMYCHWSEFTKFTFFVHVSSTAHQQPRKLSGSHDCRIAVFRDSCQIWKVLSSGTSTYSWCSGLSNFVSYNLLVLKLRYIFESLAPYVCLVGFQLNALPTDGIHGWARISSPLSTGPE